MTVVLDAVVLTNKTNDHAKTLQYMKMLTMGKIDKYEMNHMNNFI